MPSRPQKAEYTAPSENRSNSLDQDHELPTYEDSTPRLSTLQSQSTSSSLATALGPTITSPFNFPSDNGPPPPEYTSSRPIAIPQQWPQATAPFLPAYAPILLQHGIPATSWYNFLDTTSAFLTAKVGKRAVSHAGDVASSIARVPKQLGKSVSNHVKDTLTSLSENVKKNPISLIPGVIGATIGLTVGTALKITGSVVSLPGTAIGASLNMKTAKDRAEAYAVAANKDWFHKRGLHVQLMNTAELAVHLQVSVQQILDAIISAPSTAQGQMHALSDLLEGVQVRKKSLAASTGAAELSPTGYPADVKQEPAKLKRAFSNVAGSSKASAVHDDNATTSLQISAETLWLVLRRDSPPTVPKKPGA